MIVGGCMMVGREMGHTQMSGSTHHRRMEHDIAVEKMEQWMRQNEGYNLQIHEYYQQQEE
jgi:hypothetical protein